MLYKRDAFHAYVHACISRDMLQRRRDVSFFRISKLGLLSSSFRTPKQIALFIFHRRDFPTANRLFSNSLLDFYYFFFKAVRLMDLK